MLVPGIKLAARVHAIEIVIVRCTQQFDCVILVAFLPARWPVCQPALAVAGAAEREQHPPRSFAPAHRPLAAKQCDTIRNRTGSYRVIFIDIDSDQMPAVNPLACTRAMRDLGVFQCEMPVGNRHGVTNPFAIVEPPPRHLAAQLWLDCLARSIGRNYAGEVVQNPVALGPFRPTLPQAPLRKFHNIP
jgi:hypothetical protein